MNAPDSALQHRHARISGISYKFQRLREDLRKAVSSGELRGKLPGERVLAQRFKVNAKTLSKALTDLAAEGVLERIIGRGTFVRGAVGATNQPGRWLLLSSSAEVPPTLIEALGTLNSHIDVIADVAGLRPSFLGQFAAVIDLSSRTPEAFLRELALRNMPVVLVNREPGPLSLHAVLLDVALGGARLAREMLLLGHRKFLAVERRNSALLGRAVRNVASRYDSHATVESCAPEESSAIVEAQATAIICDSASAATAVRVAVEDAGLRIPEHISLGAVGCETDPHPATGYYVSPEELAGAIAGVLRDAQNTRPTVLWLNGTWVDAATIGSFTPMDPGSDADTRLGLVM